jgi:hypothetical protein
MAPRPKLVLLLPRDLDAFLLRDQARDLLRADGAVAVEPGRVPYGVLGRMTPPLGTALAGRLAKRLRFSGPPAVTVIFHPFQLPLAEALGGELWYGRWDRYEEAYDAGPRTKERLAELHERAMAKAEVVFSVNEALGGTVVVPLAADSFPSFDPRESVVAVSLGHLGRRTDWALLRAVAERTPELTLLLIGERHDHESGGDEDFAWCVQHPGFVWLGRRSDEEAARLLALAQVGIVPFERHPFNETALPFRILKYARLGLRTVAPPLPGLAPWARAVDTANTPEEWAAALRAARPEPELREWALGQTAKTVNAPLWERLEALGIHPVR